MRDVWTPDLQILGVDASCEGGSTNIALGNKLGALEIWGFSYEFEDETANPSSGVIDVVAIYNFEVQYTVTNPLAVDATVTSATLTDGFSGGSTTVSNVAVPALSTVNIGTAPGTVILPQKTSDISFNLELSGQSASGVACSDSEPFSF